MKAVVFTEEPGMGNAFVTSFKDEDEAQDYADQNECITFTFKELDNEVDRLRRWMTHAYEEFRLARNKMLHAQKMLDAMYEYEEPLEVK